MPFRLRLRQRSPETVQTLLLAVFGNIQHPTARQVIDHRHVLVPLAERLFVHPKMADGVGLPALQAALHGALHDAVDLIPAQSQLLTHGLLAGGFQPGNGEGFKQRGKAAGGFGPGQLHHAHAVRGALGARRIGVQDGAVLTSVQVAPLPFGLVVIEFAGRSALGAGPTGQSSWVR